MEFAYPFERALTGELSHHLKTTMAKSEQEEGSEDGIARRNSRNGYSKKTVHPKVLSSGLRC